MASLKSPKNKYYAEIHFQKPLTGIGSVSTAYGNTREELAANMQPLVDQAKQAGISYNTVTYENQKKYPEFDWKKLEG